MRGIFRGCGVKGLGWIVDRLCGGWECVMVLLGRKCFWGVKGSGLLGRVMRL